MDGLYALVAGVLVAVGVDLLLRPDLFRVVLGISVLSNAVNLVVLTAGRLGPMQPPIIPAGAERIATAYANPLPQALVLTAIVIGLGLTTFALVLLVRLHRTLGSADVPAPPDPEALDERDA